MNTIPPTATPRTQSQLLPINSHTLPGDVVYADFARALERDLTAERERVRLLSEHGIEALMVARSWQMVWGDKLSPDSVAIFTKHEQAFLAALAATEAKP